MFVAFSERSSNPRSMKALLLLLLLLHRDGHVRLDDWMPSVQRACTN
jgi:hypothetical protein